MNSDASLQPLTGHGLPTGHGLQCTLNDPPLVPSVPETRQNNNNKLPSLTEEDKKDIVRIAEEAKYRAFGKYPEKQGKRLPLIKVERESIFREAINAKRKGEPFSYHTLGLAQQLQPSDGQNKKKKKKKKEKIQLQHQSHLQPQPQSQSHPHPEYVPGGPLELTTHENIEKLPAGYSYTPNDNLIIPKKCKALCIAKNRHFYSVYKGSLRTGYIFPSSILKAGCKYKSARARKRAAASRNLVAIQRNAAITGLRNQLPKIPIREAECVIEMACKMFKPVNELSLEQVLTAALFHIRYTHADYLNQLIIASDKLFSGEQKPRRWKKWRKVGMVMGEANKAVHSVVEGVWAGWGGNPSLLDTYHGSSSTPVLSENEQKKEMSSVKREIRRIELEIWWKARESTKQVATEGVGEIEAENSGTHVNRRSMIEVQLGRPGAMVAIANTKSELGQEPEHTMARAFHLSSWEKCGVGKPAKEVTATEGARKKNNAGDVEDADVNGYVFKSATGRPTRLAALVARERNIYDLQRLDETETDSQTETDSEMEEIESREPIGLGNISTVDPLSDSEIKKEESWETACQGRVGYMEAPAIVRPNSEDKSKPMRRNNFVKRKSTEIAELDSEPPMKKQLTEEFFPLSSPTVKIKAESQVNQPKIYTKQEENLLFAPAVLPSITQPASIIIKEQDLLPMEITDLYNTTKTSTDTISLPNRMITPITDGVLNPEERLTLIQALIQPNPGPEAAVDATSGVQEILMTDDDEVFDSFSTIKMESTW